MKIHRHEIFRFVAISFLFFVAGLGCAKKNDFLYYVNPASVVSSHKIKDMVGNNNLDLLWVIDNSGSMASYQASVQANTAVFMKALVKGSSLNWRLALVSTDVADRPFVGMAVGDILDSTNADPVNRFNTAVGRLGTSGSSVEKTFEPIENAITAYPNFIRPNASLAIILVSDAPEQSSVSTADFLKFLAGVKGDTKSILFYGVLCPKDWCPPTDDTWWWKGSKFEELSNNLKGKSYPICDQNFSRNLVSIGSDIAKQVTSPKIFLKSRPDLKTLQVVYKGQNLPGGTKSAGGYWLYNYSLNAIVFNDLSFAPNEIEEVQVTYMNDPGV